MIKPYNRALGAKGKQKTAAFGSSPLWCLTAPPSPRCEACHTILRSLTLPYESCSLATPLKRWDYGCCAMWHMSLQVNIGEISPTGGDAATGSRRGVFPTGEGRLYGFPLALWGGFEGFIIRGAFLMSRHPPSCRLVFNVFSLTCCMYRDSSLRSE